MPLEVEAPEFLHGAWYYERHREGSEFAVLCRRVGALDAAEEVVLDRDALAAQHGYMNVSMVKISNDGKQLLYTIDTTGDESFDAYIVTLDEGTGEHRLVCHDVVSVEFSPDSQSVIYTRADDQLRPYQAWIHTLESSVDSAVLLYEESDTSYILDVSRSKDGSSVFLSSNSKSTSEVRVLIMDPTTEAGYQCQLIRGREDGVQYFADRLGDWYIIMASGPEDKEPERTLYRASVKADGGAAPWEAIMRGRAGDAMDDVDVFESFLAVYGRVQGKPAVRILEDYQGETQDMASMGTDKGVRVDIPEPYTAIRPGVPLLLYGVASLIGALQV